MNGVKKILFCDERAESERTDILDYSNIKNYVHVIVLPQYLL